MHLSKKIGSILTLSLMIVGGSVLASSHREAPGIAMDPAADLTDVYAFIPNDGDGDKDDTKPGAAAKNLVVVIDVGPGQLAASGPNWYRFDDEVIYKIHIDNTGDAHSNITYEFRFKTATGTQAGSLPLAFIPGVPPNGPFAGVTFDPKKGPHGSYISNLSQFYEVRVIKEGRDKVLANGLPVAPPRVGPATTDVANPALSVDFNSPTKTDPKLADQKYTALANNAIIKVNGYRFFAGPRNDPFFVDLGGVFDGLNIRLPGISGTPVDSLKGLNVSSIVVEIPVSEISTATNNTTFGVWATTHRIKGQREVQVSRLGNPLVNEVVIGIKDKDKFNATPPHDDVKNFASYVTTPSLAHLINFLYGASAGATAKLTQPIDETNRTDLVTAFVTGIPGINQIPNAKGTGDILRVNTKFPIEWPNGRTLTDNVVKTALTVLAQCKLTLVLPKTVAYVTGPNFSGTAAEKAAIVQLATSVGKYDATTANCALDSGVTQDDLTLGGTGQTSTFPYVGIPHSSYGVRGAIK